MSRDIRSFFGPKKGGSIASVPAKIENKASKKVLLSDDEDDFVPESPATRKDVKTYKVSGKRRILDDSDEETSPKKSKANVKQNTVKSNDNVKTAKDVKSSKSMKEVKASDIFSSAPVKRVKKAENEKNKDLSKKEKATVDSTLKSEINIHSDPEFKKTLIEIDQDEIIGQTSSKTPLKTHTSSKVLGKSKEPVNEPSAKNKLSEKIEVKQPSKNDNVVAEKQSTLNKSKKANEIINEESSKSKLPHKVDLDILPKHDKSKSVSHKEVKINGNQPHLSLPAEKLENTKKKRDYSEFLSDVNSSEVEVPSEDFIEEDDIVDSQNATQQINKRRKVEHDSNDSVLSDEDRFERKRHSAILYQKYLNRSGPKHHGSKEIPEGSKDCFSGLVFVLTGVMDSLDREEATEIINKYGGKVNSGVTGKVTHVLYGDEAGPAKLAKAEKLSIPLLTEDDFIQLIKSKSKSKIESVKPDLKSRSKIKSEKVSPKKEKSLPRKEKESPKKEKRKESLDSTKKSKFSSLQKYSGEDVTKRKDLKVEDSKGIENGVATSSKAVNSFYSNGIADNKIVQPDRVTTSTKPVLDSSNLAWVDKYKPQNVKQIIGQHGDASNAKKLITWLTNWYYNRKMKLPKPSPWAKSDDGGYYKAVLLSGPPGVGKTTTVSLVCKELGFDTVEFNASDTRSKTLIKEQISELLTSNSLAGYAQGKTGKNAVTKKHVLVMDEVDGMAGNEDRGGLQELISLIRVASVPIICMCNDRDSPKMRSLVNYCYDLRFQRPRVEQIKAALMSICFKEGIKITPDAVAQLIVCANQDVRQTLHLLSMWSAADKNMTIGSVNRDSKTARKDKKLGPWDVVRRVFSAEEHKTMSIHDKSDLFFHDYSISPLFVQENYLTSMPHCPKDDLLKRFSQAADSISCGDLVDATIRGRSAWSLLPVQAMYSSVIPGSLLSGHLTGQIQFPSWLGKNSRRNKLQRLAQEIHAHTRLSTSGSKQSIILDYAPHLRDAVVMPLVRDKLDGVPQSLDALHNYHLLREDLDSLTELSMWPGQRDPMIMVDSKIKAAMTRTYNKEAAPLPYAPAAIKKTKSTVSTEDTELLGVEEDEMVDENEDSDPENDAMIKKPKTKTSSKEAASQSAKNKSKDGKGKSKLKK